MGAVSQMNGAKNRHFCFHREQREAAAKAEAKEMAAALKTNIEEQDKYQLAEEGEDEGPLDLSATQRRIREVARVLDNFKALRNPERSRKEYLEQVCPPTLGKDQESTNEIMNGAMREKRN